ncbi:MAG: hypothetical protein WC926_03015 [Candidatus Paceibacterota bacterium]|jgi:hypothetical protein
MSKPTGGTAGLLVLAVLIMAIFGGWYFFTKKSPEGGPCSGDANCQNGLRCVNNICSSGNLGSACVQKGDCITGDCVLGKCSNAIPAAQCSNYKECSDGLFCIKGSCVAPQNYTKYFSRVVVAKMKPGLPAGVTNPTVSETDFKTSDDIEIDFFGVQPDSKGEIYYEFINATTGETAMSSEAYPKRIEGYDQGMGMDMPVPAGSYDVNVYFNGEFIYSTAITVSE